uniref:Zinc finger HIT domain-containing protein 2 n=2 Tax=Lygus hesperus TaxID=30085 RepID=A0A0A9ZCR7_LYGHE
MDDDPDNALCQLCKDEIFKYVCPRCNIPYCSVRCYQSQAHSDCSEEFYKENIQEWLKAEGPDSESKKTMMEMLKKFENQNLDEDDLETDNDSDDEGSLTDRLAEVDLDDPDEVWDRLLPEERQEFLEMLKNGDVTKLIPEWEPWWEKRYHVPKVRFLDDPIEPEYVGVCPNIVSVPDFSVLTKIEPSPQVYFNVVNVLASFAVTARYLNGDFDAMPVEAAATVMFVSKNLSNHEVFGDFDTAIESVSQSVIECSWVSLDVDSKRSDLLAQDVKNILAGPNEEHPLFYAKAALSCLISLMRSAKKFSKKPVKGAFSAQFPEHASEAVPHPSKDVLTKCSKKLEYYLSWAEVHLLKYCAK